MRRALPGRDEAELYWGLHFALSMAHHTIREKERLTKLFLQPSADRQRQEEDIAAASSRYNIGAVNRTVNLPVLALDVLHLQNRAWFTFHLAKRSGPGATSHDRGQS